jgi:hypothetical protein
LLEEFLRSWNYWIHYIFYRTPTEASDFSNLGVCKEYLCRYKLACTSDSLFGLITCPVIIHKFFLQDDVVRPRVLLTHIPLYRPDDTYCGPDRTSPIINQVKFMSVSWSESIVIMLYFVEQCPSEYCYAMGFVWILIFSDLLVAVLETTNYSLL